MAQRLARSTGKLKVGSSTPASDSNHHYFFSLSLSQYNSFGCSQK